MTRAPLAPLAAVVALCACEPQIKLTVALPAGLSASDVSLRAAGFAPSAQANVDCDQIAFGDVGRDALFSSQLFDEPLDASDGALGPVPRNGTKIVLVDALDGDGALVAAGCASVGTVPAAGARVEVDLERTADVAFAAPDALLVATLDGPGASAPAAIVDRKTGAALSSLDVALTAGGAPVDGTVRVSLVDASGAATTAGVVAVAGGSASLPAIVVDRPGPFQLEVRSRFARGDAPAPLLGVAAFKNFDVTVSGSVLDGVAGVALVGGGFVSVKAGGGNDVDVGFVDVHQSAPVTPGAPLSSASSVVTVPSATPAEALGLVPGPGGPTVLVRVGGRDACGAALTSCAVAVSAAGTTSLGSENVRPGAAPVGPCPGDGSVGLVEAQSDAPRLFVADFGAGALLPTTTSDRLNAIELDASACADDDAGRAHRIVRASVVVGNIRVPFVVDAGDGVALPPPAAVTTTALEVPGLIGGLAMTEDAATHALLLPLAQPGGFAVASLVLSSGVLVEQAAELETADAPVAIASGDFTGASNDELAVLTFPGDGSVASARALVFVAGAPVDGKRVSGALPVDCRTARDCWMQAADLDGDGLDEVLLAHVDTANAAHLEVLRFGAP